MAEFIYYMGNHVLQTTGTPALVSTATAANVMLQLSSPTTHAFTIVEWGISFSGAPSAIMCQLRNTSAATTLGTAGIINAISFGAPTSASSSSTTTSAFNSTSSAVTPITGTVITYDTQNLSTNTYIKQWPLGREPIMAASTFTQVVVTAAAAVNATCYINWRE